MVFKNDRLTKQKTIVKRSFSKTITNPRQVYHTVQCFNFLTQTIVQDSEDEELLDLDTYLYFSQIIFFFKINSFLTQICTIVQDSDNEELLDLELLETIPSTTEQRTASPLPSKRVKQALEFWSSGGDYYYLQIASYVVSVGQVT